MAENEEYPFPVWGTQGGGLVKQEGDSFIFVIKPDCPGLNTGDTMPSEWSIAAANQAARELEDDLARDGLI